MKISLKRKYNKDALWGLLFVSIPIISVIVFTFIPATISIYMSLIEWNGFIPLEEAEFVGLKNFTSFLVDGIYVKEFKNSLIVTIILMLSVPVYVTIAFLLAFALNRKATIGKNGLRLVYFLPFISSSVAITLIFKNLFDVNGVINSLIEFLGLQSVNWLRSPELSRAVIIVMLIWRNIGYTMLLYLGGLQGISAEIYEAAKIDGANVSQTIRKIVLPELTDITFFVLVTNIISGFQIYTEPNILFQSSSGKGPMNGTETMMIFMMYLYNGNNLGIASAISWAITVLILFATLIQFLYKKRRERNG